MNGERLAPAVHPAANLRPAERPLYGHRNAQADVPVSGGCIDVGLEIRWQHHVHASVARANRPTGSHFGTRQDTRIHAAVPGLDVQRVEASCDSDLAVARVRLDLSVDITRFDGPISGAQPDISLQAVHYNAPVIRVQINGAVEGVGLHRPVPGMYVHIAVERGNFHRAIACFHLQVAFTRHADLNVQVPGIVAPAEGPTAGDACNKLNLVALLPGVNPQILAQLVPSVFDPEFHLFAVAWAYTDAPVVGFDPDVGAPGHGKGLHDLFGPGTGRYCGEGQKGRAGHSEPHGNRGVVKQLHGQMTSAIQRSTLRYDSQGQKVPFRESARPWLGSIPLRRALLLDPRTGRPRLGPEGSQEFRGGQRIDDILLLEPAAPRHGDAVADEREVAGAVRIGRDDHLHAAVLAHAEIHVLQVETVGIGVALHRHAVFRASRQYFFHVVVEGIPAQKEPPGGMRDDLCVGVFDGRQHALGHGGAVEIEVRVDRADHHIELRKDFVVIIQRPFLQDVHFRPGEYTNPQILLVSGVDFLDVRRHALFIEPIGYGDGFRMVGDGNVVVAELPGRFGHFLDRILAVARRGVHLQVALHILEGDEMRKFVIFGGGDFAGVFAQFRRDEIELQFHPAG